VPSGSCTGESDVIGPESPSIHQAARRDQGCAPRRAVDGRTWPGRLGAHVISRPPPAHRSVREDGAAKGDRRRTWQSAPFYATSARTGCGFRLARSFDPRVRMRAALAEKNEPSSGSQEPLDLEGSSTVTHRSPKLRRRGDTAGMSRRPMPGKRSCRGAQGALLDIDRDVRSSPPRTPDRRISAGASFPPRTRPISGSPGLLHARRRGPSRPS